METKFEKLEKVLSELNISDKELINWVMGLHRLRRSDREEKRTSLCPDRRFRGSGRNEP